MINKRFPLGPLHLDEKDLNTNLGKGKMIFVGHTVDLFANDVPAEWIEKTVHQCCLYPENRYLFQSKNPARMKDFSLNFPQNVLLATTIETNRTQYYESKAPSYDKRAIGLSELNKMGFETMVTIEPIFDFDLEELVNLVVLANPIWINIGADSKCHNLPEPSKEKVVALIESLQSKTRVELKRNLSRILEGLD
jgi:hypothetical protein